jgi:hypothetical protein
MNDAALYTAGVAWSERKKKGYPFALYHPMPARLLVKDSVGSP